MKLNPCDRQVQPDKLHGTYPQRQSELYMQRIPLWGGRITPAILKALADIAAKYTGGTALHLTTRQSIELHNVSQSDTPEVLRRLAALGLWTFGAGGDNVRTITVCTCCSADTAAYDVEPLAEAVNTLITDQRPSLRLPRKFKMTFYGCRSPLSKPYANDLAFGAVSETTVRVIGAGSLGARPEPGIVLYESLHIGDIPALVQAAVALFDQHGDRQNRRQARLRHVRQRLGDDRFMQMLNDFFQQHRNRALPLNLKLQKGEPGWTRHTLQLVAGELPPKTAIQIAELAETHDARIRVNFCHGIDLFTKTHIDFTEELQPLPDRPTITACPGNSTCTNGIVNCRDMAAKLSAELAGIPGLKGKTIALSGCPNNCSHSCIADIGLVGRLKTVDGQQHEAYQVLLNGDNGRSRRLAEPAEIALADELPAKIRAITRSD